MWIVDEHSCNCTVVALSSGVVVAIRGNVKAKLRMWWLRCGIYNKCRDLEKNKETFCLVKGNMPGEVPPIYTIG